MESFLGQIILFAGNYAPDGWLPCLGQALNIAQYQALYSIIGTYYGGDGKTTFALPDLRGRVAIGITNSSTPAGRIGPVVIGNNGGTTQVQLNSSVLPAHSHTATFAGTAGPAQAVPVGIPAVSAATTNTTTPGPTTSLANSVSTNVVSHGTSVVTTTETYSADTPNTTLKPFNLNVPGSIAAGTVTVGNTGGSAALTVQPPFVTINYIICASSGIYPVNPN